MGRGKRIKGLLDARGMTARDLAKRVGCTEVSMSRYINETRIPKVNEMAKIAAALDTTIDYLETGKTNNKKRRITMVEEIKDRACIEVYESFCGVDFIFAVEKPHEKEAAKVLSEAVDYYLEAEPDGGLLNFLCRRMDEEIGAIYYQVFYSDPEF